jgi:tetratricopeptide (TPR) repeat protein
VEMYEKHLAIAREVGDRACEGTAYSNLELSYKSMGQFQKVMEMREKRLAIAREVGDRAGAGHADAATGQDEPTQIDDRQFEEAARNALDSAHRPTGNYDEVLKVQSQSTVAEDASERRRLVRDALSPP